jgi:hypothetical protein
MDIIIIYPNKTRRTLRKGITRADWLRFCERLPPRYPMNAGNVAITTIYLTQGDKILEIARLQTPT